jgi:GNAT superfamily N-acetyltransferase
MKPRLRSVQIKVLTPDPVHARELVEAQGKIYPKEMRESERDILRILESSDLSCGAYKNSHLIGYVLVKGAPQGGAVYIYDIAVLPEYQRKGLGTALAKQILKQAGAKGLNVSLHTRATSYPLFGNRAKMREMGYEIVQDELRPDWYFKEFGVHEDAHELLMEPLDKGRS